MLLGEKFPGKVPETPFEKLIQGKVYMRLNRNTFLTNMVVIMPFAYQIFMKKLQTQLE